MPEYVRGYVRGDGRGVFPYLRNPRFVLQRRLYDGAWEDVRVFDSSDAAGAAMSRASREMGQVGVETRGLFRVIPRGAAVP